MSVVDSVVGRRGRTLSASGCSARPRRPFSAERSLMHPFSVLVLVVGLGTLLGVPVSVASQFATPAGSPPSAASGDFAGLVDVGDGRRLWLECRGHGSPTVVLEAAYGDSALIWDAIALPPESD